MFVIFLCVPLFLLGYLAATVLVGVRASTGEQVSRRELLLGVVREVTSCLVSSWLDSL